MESATGEGGGAGMSTIQVHTLTGEIVFVPVRDGDGDEGGGRPWEIQGVPAEIVSMFALPAHMLQGGKERTR
jgi:hypothetical protein